MFVTQYYFCQSQKIEAGDTPAPHRGQDEKEEHHHCGTPLFLSNVLEDFARVGVDRHTACVHISYVRLNLIN